MNKTIKNPLSQFINLNSHEVIVEVDGAHHRLPKYKTVPRAVYTQTLNSDGFSYNVKTIGVNALPQKMHNKSIVVSREVLRAVRVVGKRLISTEEIKLLLLEQSMSRKDFISRVSKTSRKSLDKFWPEFVAYTREVEGTTPGALFKELKRYLGRTDIFVPGTKIQDASGKVSACRGLIQNIDSDVYCEETE